MGANKVLSHAIAGRMLTQLGNGASKDHVANDLKKTKQSLHLARRAFFDKDPKAITLLQLRDDEDDGGDSTEDEIYLFERKDAEDGE